MCKRSQECKETYCLHFARFECMLCFLQFLSIFTVCGSSTSSLAHVTVQVRMECNSDPFGLGSAFICLTLSDSAAA